MVDTELPTLPKWTDSVAVTTYLTSLVGVVGTVLGLLHPGFTEPPIVAAVVTPVGLLVAGAAQVVNAVTHRSAHAVARKSSPGTAGSSAAPVATPAVIAQARTALAQAQNALAAAAPGK